MDDMLGELDSVLAEDTLYDDFDLPLDTQFRSRAYTWPSKPLSYESPAVCNAEPEFVPLPTLKVGDLATTNSGSTNLSSANEASPNAEPPGSPDTTGSTRKVSSRRNAWGNLSYADLIAKAIESSPDQRLTLSQIYAWMVANVPFFSDKGDSNSSAGWKNSIRHNLSLHSRFVRVQNEGTGKSSWWMLSSDNNSSKAPRKRAGTMDAVSNFRRPGKLGKRLTSGPLKAAHSTELHRSESGNMVAVDDVVTQPSGGLPMLNEPGLSTYGAVSTSQHSFREYRNRSHSGEASSTGGCSPAVDPLMPAGWDVRTFLTPDSLGMTSPFGSGSPQAASDHHGAQNPCQKSPPLYHLPQTQSQPGFITNEAYAHGVPIHRPAQPPSCQYSMSVSHDGAAAHRQVANYPSYTGGGQVMSDGNSSIHRQQCAAAVIDEASMPNSASSVLGNMLMSGGSMSMQQTSNANVLPNLGSVPAQANVKPTGQRPFPVNHKLLMQLLANKPHLAARLQQLMELKRRQQAASAAAAAAVTSTTQSMQLSSEQYSYPVDNHSPILEQLLTSGTVNVDTAISSSGMPFVSSQSYGDIDFPNDLDLNLLDFESTSDIDCDIEQVIQHELAFGDKLDFSFDQLHLDEFINNQ